MFKKAGLVSRLLRPRAASLLGRSDVDRVSELGSGVRHNSCEAITSLGNRGLGGVWCSLPSVHRVGCLVLHWADSRGVRVRRVTVTLWRREGW